MADVSVNVGVTGISQLKSGMSDAQASIKGLDAALKLNEKQMKANGNAEQDMAARVDLLNGKLQAQRRLLQTAEQALKQMKDNGVDASSKAYQDMQRKVLEAQSAIMDTQADIENVGKSAADAAGKTDQLATSLGGLNKKVSLEQVIGVVDKITDGMEKAAKKAKDLGKAIWENITDTARWSDDTATQAMILNMGVEEYQQYKGVFDTIGEITVAEWQKAKQKVQKAIHDPTDEQTTIMDLLGVKTHDGYQGKNGWVDATAKDFEEVFWEIGETLKEKVERGELTQDLADTYANALFGKGFSELNPMFELGEQGFKEALEQQTVASEEAIKKNAELNDKLITLQETFNALKTEVLAGLAPGLTAAADSLNGLLQSVMEYLDTPEGRTALANLEDAVTGLFDDLGKIDPEAVIEGFTGVLGKVIDGINWVVENKDTVISALEGIVIGWGALKLTGGVLDIIKLIEGISGLASGGAAAEAASAGAAAGASWGGAFATAVQAAAPWLVFLYELLKPSATANDKLDSVTAGGYIQQGAIDFWNMNPENWQKRQQAIAEAYGNMGTIMTTKEALNIVLNPSISDEEAIQKLEDELGFKPIEIPADLVAQPDAAENLAGQIGAVEVPVVFVTTTGDPIKKDRTPRRNGLGGLGHANGLPYVPIDGLYFLHQGEEVRTAREVASRNFTSNLYVENMNMSNGQDAEGLAQRVAAENRRVMSGYGSM